MRVLALDLGNHCGWALSEDGVYQSGVWNLTPRTHEGAGMRGVRFMQCLDAVGKVDRLHFEEVRRHLGTGAAHVYGGYVALIGVWCERNGIEDYGAVPVGEIKKYATGRGNADKDAMLLTARKRWSGVKIVDDNQADALWLLDYVMKDYAPTP